jgi:hypothetical protein
MAKPAVAGKKVRIQNVSTEQTVKASAGTMYRILLSNGGGSARTLTLTDGATTQTVINLAANATVNLELNVRFSTSIKVTPSHAEVDALVIYD